MAIYSLQQRIFIVKYFYQSGNSTKNVLTEFPNRFLDYVLPTEDEIQTFVKLFEEFGSVYGPSIASDELEPDINYINRSTIESVEVKIEPSLFETDFNNTDSLEISENENDLQSAEDCEEAKDDLESEKSYSISNSDTDEEENSWSEAITSERKPAKGGLRIKCDECDKVFNRHILYERHRRAHLNTCTICNKRVVNLMAHMQMHEGILPYQCSICHQRFKFNDRLKRHMATHSEVRPFKCETCQNCFKTKDRLREHIKIHMPMEERPKKCHLCEKRFLNNVELNRHIRSHTGEKPTLCNECGKGFRTLYQLNMHKRTHTGEKPHSCDICGKTFSRNAGLIIHQRLHTGERPYKCRYCDKSFTDSGGRKMHEHVHLDDRPYKCVLCNKAYNFGSSLRSHIKLTHPKKSNQLVMIPAT